MRTSEPWQMTLSMRADASPLRGFVDAGKIREIEKLIAHHGGVVVGEGELLPELAHHVVERLDVVAHLAHEYTSAWVQGCMGA